MLSVSLVKSVGLKFNVVVENQGFEPWEGLTLRRISNPVHSTNSANSP